jgi:hypothetical protein
VSSVRIRPIDAGAGAETASSADAIDRASVAADAGERTPSRT